jgi:peptidyl-tRNA hydrolase
MNDYSIVLGLGNFGETYYDTRHNIGFAVLDYLQFFLNAELVKKKTIYFLKKHCTQRKRKKIFTLSIL